MAAPHSELDDLLGRLRSMAPETLVTATIMAPLCLQCGMPLNNMQETYQRVMQEVGPAGLLASRTAAVGFEQGVYEWLHKARLCCRVNLSRSAADSRLRFALPVSTPFVDVRRDTKDGAPPVVLHTDGTTRIHEHPPREWLEP